jgi:hypothetical protein
MLLMQYLIFEEWQPALVPGAIVRDPPQLAGGSYIVDRV